MNKVGTRATIREWIADALDDRSDELVEKLVATYRHNPGYEALDHGTYDADLLPVAAANQRLLTCSLRGQSHDPVDIRIIAESAVRRLGQGVPESEVMRAYRLWSMAIWTEINEIRNTIEGIDPDDLVDLAAVVLEHNEFAGGLAADAFEDEQQGIWIQGSPLRGAPLERLLTQTASPEEIEALRLLHFPLDPDPNPSILMVGSRYDKSIGESNPVVRQVVEMWREACSGFTIVAVDGRVVILVGQLAEAESWSPPLLETGESAVAMALQPSSAGLAEAFAGCAELREVLETAQRKRPSNIPLRWQDALLGSIVRTSSEPVKARLLETYHRLQDYETHHSTPLLRTLDAYMSNDLNVSVTTKQLFCHSNTVRYRLHRVRELTGLDPHVERDRAILKLAITLRAVDDYA